MSGVVGHPALLGRDGDDTAHAGVHPLPELRADLQVGSFAWDLSGVGLPASTHRTGEPKFSQCCPLSSGTGIRRCSGGAGTVG